MGALVFDLNEHDDIGFAQQVRPIVAGVLHVVEPLEVYLVKIDNWFGEKWLGFSNKLVGAVGVQYRQTLRVPPFVPARVVAQRFHRREADGDYIEGDAALNLHVEQTSEDNARRLMSVVCPNAAVFWWSGGSRTNQRGSLMAYLPTSSGHSGWYADFKKVHEWSVGKALCTTTRELSTYAASVPAH